MTRVRQLWALLLIGAGVGLAVAGVRLRLQGEYGPGPGFAPFWVGVPLAALGAAWLVQVSMTGPAPPAGDEAAPPGGGRRVVAVLGALVAFALLLMPLGFKVSMLGLLLFLFFAFDRAHVLPKLLVAVAGSVGTYYAFERLLRVPLPSASLPVLRSLGL